MHKGHTLTWIYTPINQSDHLNIRKPFNMSAIKEYGHRQEALDFMRNHINIISNREVAVFKYFCM